MKKLLLLFVIIACSVSSYATTYYVVTSGGNNANTGLDSTSNALATLAGAVSKSTSGDIIWMCAGTHTINTTVNLPIGISVRGSGSGVASKITSTSLTSEWTPIINMTSSSQSNGNQEISYLYFDGNNMTVAQTFWIEKRNGVKIHHCKFLNFKYLVAYWLCDGGDIGSDPYSTITYPNNYCTGSEIYNNTVTNCSYFDDYGRGAFTLIGHDGIKIHDNTITQSGRANNLNGYCLKMVFIRGGEIYNNNITLADFTWCFAIESFVLEGVNIHDNNIVGGIDVNISRKESSGKTYDYGMWIHNNNLGPTTASSDQYYGMLLEFYHSDVIIEKNIINNCYYGLSFVPRTNNVVDNIRISYNIFKNIADGGYVIQGGMGSTTCTYTDIYFYNNIFHGSPLWGLSLFGTWNGLYFRNNIFTGASYEWFELRETTSNNVNITNNIIYGNSDNTPYFANTPTNYTNANNINQSPVFTNASSGDFTLQNSSPGRDAGYDVGLYTDIIDYTVPYNNTPDIGAYEYGSSSGSTTTPTVTTTSISSITTTSASGGGNVTSSGGATVTARGVCWNTLGTPTIENSSISNGSGTGSFTSSITGLSANTTYYIRAYATNSVGTSYGSQESFTTQSYGSPTVTTTSISNILPTEVTSGGNVTSDGGLTVTARGVCWNTTGTPTISDSHTSNSTGTGSFTSSITGLSLNQTYYVRAYATNSNGTSYGEQISFFTQTIINKRILRTTNRKMIRYSGKFIKY